jgi:hypothetical protein
MLRVQYQAKSLSRRSNVIPTTRLHFYNRSELQLGCCEPLSWRRTTWSCRAADPALPRPPPKRHSAQILPVRLHLRFALLFNNGRGREAGGAGTHIVTNVSAAILRCGYIQLFNCCETSLCLRPALRSLQAGVRGVRLGLVLTTWFVAS